MQKSKAISRFKLPQKILRQQHTFLSTWQEGKLIGVKKVSIQK
jgi:hypothetical protein